MRQIILVLSAAFSLLFTPIARAQQETRILEGKIVNEQQQPITRAVIMLYDNYNDATTSDANGAFTFDAPANKVVYIRVSLKDEINVIKVKPTDKTINIIWDKATAAASVANLEEIKKKKL